LAHAKQIELGQVGKLVTHAWVAVELEWGQRGAGGGVGARLGGCAAVQSPVGRVPRGMARARSQELDGRLRWLGAVRTDAVLLQFPLALVHHVRLQKHKLPTRQLEPQSEFRMRESNFTDHVNGT